jgi:hypothetical protein
VEAELLYALLNKHPYALSVPNILEHYWPEGKEAELRQAIQKLKDDGKVWPTPYEFDDGKMIDILVPLWKSSHRLPQNTALRIIKELNESWPFYR